MEMEERGSVGIVAIILFALIGGLFLFNSYSGDVKEIISRNRTNFINITPTDNNFARNYEWQYKGYTYGLTFELDPDAYEGHTGRERLRDYDLFASDYYSQEFIQEITAKLRNYAEQYDISEEEIPYFIISFVQHLPYTSDDVTTGFDEYPRFPYETIYDNGGDCEDTSILASAMLNELDYGAALLEFDDHMAVGVRCSPGPDQSYYTYDGIEFCYLETTGENWNIGDVPPHVEGETPKITLLAERPALRITFSSEYRYRTIDIHAVVDVNISVKNLGSDTAENTKVYVALQSEEENKVWDQAESETVPIRPENTHLYTITGLETPVGEPFRIYVRAFGDNVISDEVTSDWVYWE